jgi:hypothetical protein
VRRSMRVSRPLVLLALVSVLSLGARVAWLGSPCHEPCTTANDHLRIFDETYYVNAARVIAGIRPPAGAHYHDAPLGDDPNSEHPQGAKLIMAGAIELFGDGPFAWRIGSLLAGSLAILGMWSLARAAGADEWVAFGSAALMAADNLLLVAGRIGTLDIYAVCAMVWALALYLRDRSLWAGVVLAVGIACKEVAVYALLAVALLELGRWWVSGRPGLRVPARRFGLFALVGLGGFVALLAAMDQIAPPWDPETGRLVTGGVLGHIGHIISYGADLTSPNGPRGIASYPWEWLGDFKPIVYLSIDPNSPGRDFRGDHPVSMFLGMVSPPILLFAIPALLVAARAVVRRAVMLLPEAGSRGGGDWTAAVGVAWFAGTWVPFEAFSLLFARTSYLYYMVIVMPGIYLAVASLAGRLRRHRWWIGAWVVAVAAATIVMYPFTPLQ